MMAYSEDHIALAAEYVLGTLDAAERAQVEAMMSADPDFTALVDAWNRKLGVLNQMVGSVEPRPEVWEKIRVAIGLVAPQLPLTLPDVAPESAPRPSDDAPGGIAVDKAAEAVAPAANVVVLSRETRRWRGIARVASALAAALVALLAIQLVQPDWLPEALRQKPRVQVVEVQTPAAARHAQYVAVLRKDGGAPAFILTVDAATKEFTVRKVDAPAQPDKSYELWLISDKLGPPRSLGVIGGGDFTARTVLASYDSDVIDAATYAVTVEPQGGSPDGKPSAAPVYAGKLIETVPAQSH